MGFRLQNPLMDCTPRLWIQFQKNTFKSHCVILEEWSKFSRLSGEFYNENSAFWHSTVGFRFRYCFQNDHMMACTRGGRDRLDPAMILVRYIKMIWEMYKNSDFFEKCWFFSILSDIYTYPCHFTRIIQEAPEGTITQEAPGGAFVLPHLARKNNIYLLEKQKL